MRRLARHDADLAERGTERGARGETKTHLRGITGEVIGRLAGAGVALGDLGVAAVVGLEDGELPARGNLKLDVELAVLAVVGRRDALASLSHEAGVQERDGSQVRRELAGHGAGRAAGASEGNAGDRDLVARGGIGKAVDDDGARGGKAGEKGKGVDQLHCCGSTWSRCDECC